MRTKKEVLYTCLTTHVALDKDITDSNLHMAIQDSVEDGAVVLEVLAAMQEYATEWSKAGEEQNDLDNYIENLEQEWK